jgi:hypothetical protein
VPHHCRIAMRGYRTAGGRDDRQAGLTAAALTTPVPRTP